MSKKYWVNDNDIIVNINGEEKNITKLGVECDYCKYDEGDSCSMLGKKHGEYCDWQTFSSDWVEVDE